MKSLSTLARKASSESAAFADHLHATGPLRLRARLTSRIRVARRVRVKFAAAGDQGALADVYHGARGPPSVNSFQKGMKSEDLKQDEGSGAVRRRPALDDERERYPTELKRR